MPPQRRRRPVEPTTRVRLPRGARPRPVPPAGPTADETPALAPPADETPATAPPAKDSKPPATPPPAVEAETPATPPPAVEAETPATVPPAVEAETPATVPSAIEAETPAAQPAEPGGPAEEAAGSDAEPAGGERAGTEPSPGPDKPLLLAACLGVVTVILGGLAVWFGLEASAVGSGVDTANVALTNPAATAQVTRQVTHAVDTIFSYSYADTARTSTAARSLLTGRARQQYQNLFKLVQEEAPKEKLVLTTTVTSSGVELLVGNNARLLVFANQRDTGMSTHQTTEAGAMFAVDAVRVAGRWKITRIDTYGSGA